MQRVGASAELQADDVPRTPQQPPRPAPSPLLSRGRGLALEEGRSRSRSGGGRRGGGGGVACLGEAGAELDDAAEATQPGSGSSASGSAGGGSSSGEASQRPQLRRSLAATALGLQGAGGGGGGRGGGGSGADVDTSAPEAGASPERPEEPRRVTLRSSLEEDFGVDSWNLRAEPAAGARVVATVSMGEVLEVLGVTADGEWLRIALPTTAGSVGGAAVVYAARYFVAPSVLGQYEAFAPLGAPEPRGGGVQPLRADGGGIIAADRVQSLLSELVGLRHQYETLLADRSDELTRARTARRIEDIMSKLEFLGISPEEVLSMEDPMNLILFSRTHSFSHRDFANPEAETCWLSCLFQALWHSVVFHVAFDLYLAPAKCTPGPGEKILAALQRTWSQYALQSAADARRASRQQDPDGSPDSDDSLEASPMELVPADDLVDAFGVGYGDMSEALASIQNELSDSPNLAAKAIADLIVLIPLTTLGESWPVPEMAWRQAQEWKVHGSPLIAVDLSMPPLTRTSCGFVARLWLPSARGAEDDDSDTQPMDGEDQHSESDLGPGHRLVALVCYLWSFRHYVVFCRRQREPTRCLMFNDLPGLTRGAPKELDWEQVPDACYRYSLTPRLALYESLDAAEDVVRSRRATVAAAQSSAASGRAAGRACGDDNDGAVAGGAAVGGGEGTEASSATGRTRPDSQCTHQ